MPDRVLHVLPQDIERGAQRYARELADALDSDDQPHVVLTLFESGTSALDADLSLSLPSSWARARGYEPRVAARLRRLVADVDPRVIVAHGSEPLKYVVAARLPQTLIYYKIGVTHLPARARLHRAWHRWLLARPAVVVGVSQACIDEAVDDFGVPAEETLVIPNGRQPDPYLTAVRTEGDGPVRLTFVGHLSDSKRPQVFMDIVEALRMRGAHVDGTVVGGGPLLNQIEGRAARLGVRVTGPKSTVPEILADSDVFVFTSRPEGEGMPGVLIEAGLSALPTVSTDVPGARDVIVPGETGWIVRPDAPMEAVAHLESLVGDADARRAMGSAARRRCLAHFTLDASAAAWRKLLASLS